MTAPAPAKAAGPRAPIDPTLPPDHPLEPGSAAGRPRNQASPADRIAASEAALGNSKPPVIPDGGKSNFIAAARKAAQAAALVAPSPAATPEAPPSALASLSKKLTGRLRTLIVAGSVVAIVVGGVHVVSRMFDDGTPSTTPGTKPDKTPEAEKSAGAGEPAKAAPAPSPSKPSAAPLPTPRPTPGRQSSLQDFGAAWPGQIAGLPTANGPAAALLQTLLRLSPPARFPALHWHRNRSHPRPRPAQPCQRRQRPMCPPTSSPATSCQPPSAARACAPRR